MGEKKFRWRDLIFILTIILLITIILELNAADLRLGKGSTAGLISIEGAIANSEDFLGSSVTPKEIRRLTKKAEDMGVRAIIYEINSPGGSVVASKDISRIIESVKVPTICLQEDVATSGAYWLSLGCDRIVSDPLTLTGGIGVTSSYLEFSGLLNKLGINYVNLTSGKFKDTGSPFKDVTEKEQEMIQKKLDLIRDAFVEKIISKRNISSANMSEILTGKTFLGKKAFEYGLVDSLGSYEKAVELGENLSGVENLRVKRIRTKKSINDILGNIFAKIGYGLGSSLQSSTNRFPTLK